jgi:hypothetical protein
MITRNGISFVNRAVHIKRKSCTVFVSRLLINESTTLHFEQKKKKRAQALAFFDDIDQINFFTERSDIFDVRKVGDKIVSIKRNFESNNYVRVTTTCETSNHKIVTPTNSSRFSAGASRTKSKQYSLFLTSCVDISFFFFGVDGIMKDYTWSVSLP